MQSSEIQKLIDKWKSVAGICDAVIPWREETSDPPKSWFAGHKRGIEHCIQDLQYLQNQLNTKNKK